MPALPSPQFEVLEKLPVEVLESLASLVEADRDGKVYRPDLGTLKRRWLETVDAKPYSYDRVVVELFVRGAR